MGFAFGAGLDTPAAYERRQCVVVELEDDAPSPIVWTLSACRLGNPTGRTRSDLVVTPCADDQRVDAEATGTDERCDERQPGYRHVQLVSGPGPRRVEALGAGDRDDRHDHVAEQRQPGETRQQAERHRDPTTELRHTGQDGEELARPQMRPLGHEDRRLVYTVRAARSWKGPEQLRGTVVDEDPGEGDAHDEESEVHRRPGRCGLEQHARPAGGAALTRGRAHHG